jgi:hypothetical protein
VNLNGVGVPISPWRAAVRSWAPRRPGCRETRRRLEAREDCEEEKSEKSAKLSRKEYTGDLERWMHIDHSYCRIAQLFKEAAPDGFFRTTFIPSPHDYLYKDVQWDQERGDDPGLV